MAKHLSQLGMIDKSEATDQMTELSRPCKAVSRKSILAGCGVSAEAAVRARMYP